MMQASLGGFSLNVSKGNDTNSINLWPKHRRAVLNNLLDHFSEIFSVETKRMIVPDLYKKNVSLFPFGSYYKNGNHGIHCKDKIDDGSKILELLGLHVSNKVTSVRLREMELSILRFLGDREEMMYCIFIRHTLDGDINFFPTVEELHSLWQQPNSKSVCLFNRSTPPALHAQTV